MSTDVMWFQICIGVVLIAVGMACWIANATPMDEWRDSMRSNTTRSRRGRTNQRKSKSRSATLTSRSLGRKYKKQVLRQSQTVGLPPAIRRDPNLKPWPRDCVVIVAATPSTVSVRGIVGRIIDKTCADCGTRLAIDSESIAEASAMPVRNGRPLRYICVACFFTYCRKSIDHLIDRRQTKVSSDRSDIDDE